MTGDLHLIDLVDAERLERPAAPRLSAMAEGLRGSMILQIAAEVRALLAAGRDVCNLTVGDFSPSEFRVPRALEEGVADALRSGETNYPPSNGMPALREGVRDFYERWLRLSYPTESILVTGGARPVIYGIYRALVDPGDRVVFPVPSWNNDHYCHLVGAEAVPVPCGAGTAFLPTRELLAAPIRDARLLVLNSPSNPTGTAFTAEQLAAICDLVLEENARRAASERPLFVMYDQVYWMLTFGGTRHVNPVGLRPALAPYTVYVDGISKGFAATGLRVGWAVGPRDIVARMADILTHVGAWAPRPEQVATARLLAPDADAEIVSYREQLVAGLRARLDALYAMTCALREAGHPVDAVPPMGAIYLSARFALAGRRTPDGATLATNEDIRRYLLQAAGMAVVPFQAFGDPADSGWFRLSAGAVSPAQIDALGPRLRTALDALA